MRVRASEIVVGDLTVLHSEYGTPYLAPVQRTVASRSGGTVTLTGPRMAPGASRLSRTYRAGTLVQVQRSQREEQE